MRLLQRQSYLDARRNEGRLDFTDRSRGKIWACLGDMLELGDNELDMHRGLAESVISTGFDGVFLIGSRMKSLENELKKGRYHGALVHFEKLEDLSDRDC